MTEAGWTQTTKQRGWVNGIEAEKWLRTRKWNVRPDSYCGASVGGGVRRSRVRGRTKLMV